MAGPIFEWMHEYFFHFRFGNVMAINMWRI
jgi:hypothetical protein